MDDSIYRDFYWAADRIEFWWAIVQPHLVSDTAIHIYVLLAACLALAISLFVAYKAKSRLRQLRLEAFDIRFGGQPPKRSRAIERRIEQIKKKTLEAWLGFARDFLLILVFGLFVPALGLFFLSSHYAWFDTTVAAFVDMRSRTPLHAVDQLTLASFVANQIGHGALLDFLEVFDIDFSRVASNPDNRWFSALVLLFRTIIGGFTLALVIALRDTVLILRKLRPLNQQRFAAIQAKSAPAV